ncbi:HEAT repeat domain-containing protein [candidate division KSB1 bacterium]|nr:HEAT repeat domain-containing protein [candidate division KSB1 bacterium]
MNCKDVKIAFPEYLAGQLNQEHSRQIDAHLSRCNACKEELALLRSIWIRLGNLPDEKPGPALRKRFYSMLDALETENHRSGAVISFFEKLADWLTKPRSLQPAYPFALALGCLSLGIWIGSITGGNADSGEEIGLLRNELSQMRQMVTLSLLSQSSSSERLRAIGLSQRISQPDEELTSALLNTLNTDPNVNVRLAAADALYIFSRDKTIRQALVASLAIQTSPLVQIALIDVLVAMREKKSLDALRTLIHNKQANMDVKQHARWGIEQLL